MGAALTLIPSAMDISLYPSFPHSPIFLVEHIPFTPKYNFKYLTLKITKIQIYMKLRDKEKRVRSVAENQIGPILVNKKSFKSSEFRAPYYFLTPQVQTDASLSISTI